MFILNHQKDGDGFYHIHRISCPYKPSNNYSLCNGTVVDASSILNVPQNKIKKCSHCM